MNTLTDVLADEKLRSVVLITLQECLKAIDVHNFDLSDKAAGRKSARHNILKRFKEYGVDYREIAQAQEIE